MRTIFGAIEGGGTKFNVLIGTDPDAILDEETFPTTTPAETLERIIAFFRRPRADVELRALGCASFGPIDLDPRSPTYGYITTTPKPGWAMTDLVGPLQSALDVPVGWDTDVNAAALGEHRWGAGRDVQSLVYLTVGTGIGGGAIVNGRPIHGLLHPEMGHLLVPRLDGDRFAGICPYHHDCLEGLASGPALRQRLGRPAETLDPADPVWDVEAYYLAAGIHAICHVLSPERVILGGGVGQARHLLPHIRRHVIRINHGYLAHPSFIDNIDQYIVPPALGPHSGVLGALVLARIAAGAADR